MKKSEWLSEQVVCDEWGRPPSLADVPLTIMTREQALLKQGGDAIGNLMLYFDTEDEMNNFYLDIHKHIQIKLDDSIS